MKRELERHTDAAPVEKTLQEGVVAGRNAVLEALKSGVAIEKIFVARGEKQGSIVRILSLAREKKVVVQEADRTKLDYISGITTHQGVVAYLGYLLFGAPSPLFWGVLTCLATIIPIVGTALVWLPLALYMGLEGNWGPAVGLALYGTLVVTHVDNVVRFVMQKRMADTHPLVTVFGVFVGLSLFGFMGVIFGPLLLAMFVFCVDLFKRKYLDRKPDSELFLPGGGDRA